MTDTRTQSVQLTVANVRAGSDFTRCVLCDFAFQPSDEPVEVSAEPFRLVGLSGLAHDTCAHSALVNAMAAADAARDAWFNR